MVRVKDLRFRIWALEFRISGSRFRARSLHVHVGRMFDF